MPPKVQMPTIQWCIGHCRPLPSVELHHQLCTPHSHEAAKAAQQNPSALTLWVILSGMRVPNLLPLARTVWSKIPFSPWTEAASIESCVTCRNPWSDWMQNPAASAQSGSCHQTSQCPPKTSWLDNDLDPMEIKLHLKNLKDEPTDLATEPKSKHVRAMH